MRDFIRDLPSFIPLIVAWVVLGAVLARPAGRYLGARPTVVFAALMSLGLILLATLSPNDSASPAELETACDLSRLGPPSLQTLISDRDALRNIILFLPLGLALGLLPWNKRTLVVVVGAFGLAIGIEAAQIALADVGRGCESADVVDNNIGLAIGLITGAVVGLTVRRRAG